MVKKIFKDYKQYTLVILSALLMIAFIVPQANTFVGGSPEKRKVATVNGAKVTAEEMELAIREYEALKALLEPMQLGANMNIPEQYFGVKDSRHWFLMTRAAKDAGFMATAADGERFESDLRDGIVRTYAMQIAVGDAFRKMGIPGSMLTRQFLERYAGMVMQNPEQQKEVEEATVRIQGLLMPRMLSGAAQAGRLRPDELLEVFAKANAVGRMQTTWREIARVSDKRTIAAADQTAELVYVDHLLVSGSQLASQAAEPGESTLKTLFEKHREQVRGSGEHGFGYRLPPRVKLEWMKIDRAALGATLSIDPIEANKYYRQNPQLYPKPFGEERSRVEQDMRSKRVDEILAAVDKAFRAESVRLIGKVDRRDGLIVLPADWSSRMPRLEKLAQLIVEDVKQSAGVTVPLPTVAVKADRYYSEADLGAFPEIGQSRVRVGSREISFPQFVLKVRELSTDVDFSLQSGVVYTDGFAEDESGNRYYMLVLEARKDEPPADLSEVREQVLLDAKAVEQYAALVATAEQIRQAAVAEGIEGASKQFNELFPGATAPLIRRMLEVSSDAVRDGDSTFDRPEYRDAVLQAARALDINKMVIDQPAESRTLMVAMDEPLTVAIVQLVGRAPLTVERLRAMGDSLAAAAAAKDFKVDTLRQAFSYAALKERYKFVDLSRGALEETENPVPDAKDAVPTKGS